MESIMRRAAIPALLLFAASASATAAQTTRLDATYSVYLTGIPVGRASVTIDLSDSGFSVSGSARTAKFIRILSKGEGSATVRGTLQANRILSSVFSGRYTSSRREQKIEISTENGTVKNISIEPPLPAIDERRVAITKETRKNVVDPLSAALALVSSNADKLSPEFCNRTLPVFDGRYRFDVVLSFLRTETVSGSSDGYRGPALVCRARYVPIAGHRKDAEAVGQMAKNRDMLVWLAPVQGTRVLVPVKASLSSPIGNFMVEATRFRTSAH